MVALSLQVCTVPALLRSFSLLIYKERHKLTLNLRLLFTIGISEKVVQHPNVISCPHLGASTVEAQKRVAKEIAEQILSAARGESLFGAVSY